MIKKEEEIKNKNNPQRQLRAVSCRVLACCGSLPVPCNANEADDIKVPVCCCVWPS